MQAHTYLQDLTSHFDRKDCFRRDPRIPITDSSNCSDYSHSGFDRGHLAPNGRHTCSYLYTVLEV